MRTLRSIRFTGWRVIVLILITALSACGGSGGSPSNAQQGTNNLSPSSTNDGTNNSPSTETGNHASRSTGSDSGASNAPAPQSQDNSIQSASPTARFKWPSAITSDAAGNLFIADAGNYVIRRIDRDGTVSVVAGSVGQRGLTDGAPCAARFSYLRGITVDKTGNLYVSDESSIRKISTGGIVSTLAGDPAQTGNQDGAGAQARFNAPIGLAADSNGNIYVADSENDAVRKVTPAGEVTTVSQGGPGGNSFFRPAGIALDSAGAMYVAGWTAIWKVDESSVTIFAGSAVTDSLPWGDGPGTDARFMPLGNLTIDNSGNLYVTEASTLGKCGGSHSVVRKITATGAVTTIAGKPFDDCSWPSGADGTGQNARFYLPTGITADIDGAVYVADSGNHTIRKITGGNVVSTLAGVAGEKGSSN